MPYQLFVLLVLPEGRLGEHPEGMKEFVLLETYLCLVSWLHLHPCFGLGPAAGFGFGIGLGFEIDFDFEIDFGGHPVLGCRCSLLCLFLHGCVLHGYFHD